MAPPALGAATAQDITVTASLAITDGWARVGAYVPVTLKATNQTDRAIASVRLATGGPIDVWAPWHIAPGESAEKVVRGFCATSDLAVEAVFFDRDEREIARVRPAPPTVRPAPEDAVLVGVEPSLTLTDAMRARLREVFGARPVRVFPCSDAVTGILYLGGFLDAVVCESGGTEFCITGCGPALAIRQEDIFLPPRTPMVDPGTVRLFLEGRDAGDERLRQWLMLGVHTLVVLTVAVMLASRRWAAGVLVAVGAAAAVVPAYLDRTHEVSLRQARIFYVKPKSDTAPVETLAHLASPGGGSGYVPVGGPAPQSFIQPVLVGPAEVYERHATLDLRRLRLVAHRPRLTVRWGTWGTVPISVGTISNGPESLRAVANRADVVAALLVEGNSAADAEGRTQPIDAWAVQWKTGGDADLAWAGRSLEWWDRHRRSGDGPFLVAWIRDPAPPPPPGIDVYERLPAMVIYSP